MSEVLTNNSSSSAGAPAPAVTRSSLARKRRAAGHPIPVIGEINLDPPRVPSSLSLTTEPASNDSGDDDSQTGLLKRIRHDSGISILSDESESPQSSLAFNSAFSSVGSGCSCDSTNSLNLGPQAEQIPFLVNNSVIGEYRIIGAGRDAKAVHMPTSEIFDCRILSPSELRIVTKIIDRLDHANRFYKKLDIDLMKEAVLPAKTEVVEEFSGRIVMFTPIFQKTLHNHAESRGKDVTEAELVPIFQQVMRLLSFCHAVGIIVRDLKPRKLVFDYKGKLRLSNVRECVVVDNPHEDTVHERNCSPAFVPPEVLTTGPAGYSGKAANMWSFGVLMFVLLFGRYPFYDQTARAIFQRIVHSRVTIPPNANISQHARVLLLSLLRKSAEARPTADTLLYIPWTAPKTQPTRGGGQRVTRRIFENYLSTVTDLSPPATPAVEPRPDISAHRSGATPTIEQVRALVFQTQRYLRAARLRLDS